MTRCVGSILFEKVAGHQQRAVGEPVQRKLSAMHFGMFLAVSPCFPAVFRPPEQSAFEIGFTFYEFVVGNAAEAKCVHQQPVTIKLDQPGLVIVGDSQRGSYRGYVVSVKPMRIDDFAREVSNGVRFLCGRGA